MASSERTPKPKLLVVDDERENIRTLSRSLHEEYDIIAADCGTLAIEKAVAEQPDLILLDIMMPDMDGYSVLKKLKSLDETAAIPVIFITGLIRPQDESKGIALGAADYIAKPFNVDVVRARVETQLKVAGTIHSGVVARKLAESRLELAYALINSAPQYISYKGSDGRYEFINPATCEITGYSYEELMAGGFNLLYDEAARERIVHEIIPAINKFGRYDFELPMIRKNGEVRIMAFSAFKVNSDSNQLGSIATDITERKYLREEIIEAKEQAETANRAKGEFLSRMSHELRTPLNAIAGMTAIARAAKDAAQIEDCLVKIDRASRHLTTLVNEILDMATINEGKLELICSRMSLRALIESVVVTSVSRSYRKKQSFAVHVEEDVPEFIVGDERRLSQIISNLLSNAIKFTPEYGNIELRVSATGAEEGHCTLQFMVKDDGIGIPPKQQERIFNAFEQADGSLARSYGGAGLGLAISRRFAELMGGSLWVDSAPGSGSTFFFTVDAEIVPQEKDIQDEATQNYANIAGHVLLVAEDVEINREIVAAMLEDFGVMLVFAEDGSQAVEYIRNEPDRYSLVLMDISMPNMDGYQATAAIRALDTDAARRIPIIALTANTYKEDVEQCLASGMNDHIGKPIELEDFLGKIRKHIRTV